MFDTFDSAAIESAERQIHSSKSETISARNRARRLSALVAAESFGDFRAIASALAAPDFAGAPHSPAIDAVGVFTGEHIAEALAAQDWDAIIINAAAQGFFFDEILGLINAYDARRRQGQSNGYAHIPVFVFADASTSPEQISDLLQAGVADVVSKGNMRRLAKHFFRRYADEIESAKEVESAKSAESEWAESEKSGDFAETSEQPKTTDNHNHQTRQSGEQRLQYLIQRSTDIVSLLNEKFEMTYQSPAFYRVSGYKEEEIDGRSALDIVHPDDQEKVARALSDIIEKPNAQSTATFRARTADGAYKTIESVATNCLHLPEVQAIIVNSRDVTERFQMEGALRDSEAQYKSLVENLSEGIVITDAADKFVFVNPAAEKTFGMSRANLLGKTIEPFVQREAMALIGRQNAERRDGKSGRYELEIIRANGTKRWQTVNATPRFDENGNFLGSFVIFNDVTERKNTEEANVLFSQFLERRINERTEALKRANAELKHEITERKRIEEMLLQSGERLNSLLSNSSDVITIVEENGDISYESPATEKIFGFDPFERIGQNFLDRVHPDFQEAVRTFLYDVIHYPAAIRTVECLHQSDLRRGYEWVEITASNQIHNPAVGGIVLNSREIAARKAAEEELKRTLEQEKELNDLKSRFITMVSHEFRTPLTVINSSAEILHLNVEKMPTDKQTMHLERVMASSRRIEEMLNDVLALARNEAGKTQAVFAPLNLQALCQEITTELNDAESSGDARNASPRVQFSYVSSVETLPALDAKLMRSIVTNLLSNALKYSNKDALFRVECAPDFITLEVADSGIGIPQEDQKRLFEAFHRARNTGAIKGTGIGMSIVKYAVEAHGGTIEFSSKENEGTTFVVRIPFRLPSDAPAELIISEPGMSYGGVSGVGKDSAS
jgi:PAS domain S-box-containing protein